MVRAKLDKRTLVQALENLGLHQPCDVMVHASLSALGVVEGGPETVVAALREVTCGGAFVIPSSRFAIRSDKYALTDCKNCCPRDLCPSRERGDTGIVGETVRAQPDALRSCNPTHSWVGLGKDAPFLLSGHHHSLTPCGKESPFFRLMERDGMILLLGVGVNSITNIHAVEDARNLPYLSAFDLANRHATYTTSGRRIQYVYPHLLQEVLNEVGILRSGRVGASTSYLLSARKLGAFLWVATEDDPWCLALRPRGKVYEPFQDACVKMARMAQAWQNNPDHNAWQLLLEQSRQDQSPIMFEPAEDPATNCPAYRGLLRGYHRCAANDIPPWEKFEDYPGDPGVATCQYCNWPARDKD